jgi:hypothetical protein
MRGTIGKLLGMFVLAAIGIAVWRANNGDLTAIADSVWNILSWGADLVTHLWNGFVSLTSTTETPAPPLNS